MINAITMKCPSCNADLEVDPSRKECFCSYCGAKIILTNDNEKTFTVNVNKVIDSTHREINEAEVLRAENERLKMQMDEAKEKASKEQKKKYISSRTKIGWGLIAFGILTGAITKFNQAENYIITVLIAMPLLIGIMMLLTASNFREQEIFSDDDKKK